MSFVTYERRGAIGFVTLDRPERLNAMSLALDRDAIVAFITANTDPECKVVVFSGNGRAFCAGDDLKEYADQTASDASIREHIGAIQAVTRAIVFSEKVVIGAIHGYAVGGGFEWLLNCDMVVAADDLVAFFPEMQWGQFVTGGVTHLLPQAVGHQRAMELMVLGERQTASDLLRLGLVNRVVARADLMATATALAEKVAEKSMYSVGRLKKLLTRDLSSQFERAMLLEEENTIACFGRSEAAERVAEFSKRKV